MRISDWSSDVCSSDRDTKSGDNAGSPVSITDSRGEKIELDNPATRVVSLEWMQTESLVSLGVMPVAHADGDAYNTWVANAQVDDSVKDVGKRAEPSVTEIMKADPELVIADSTSRSEEHTSELQSIMRISYAVFCLTKK